MNKIENKKSRTVITCPRWLPNTYQEQCQWAVPEKILTGDKKEGGVGWGHGISRGIAERNCGNSRGLWEKVKFPGVFMKYGCGIGYSRKNSTLGWRGRVKDIEFQGILKNSMQIFQRSITKEVEFPGVIKEKSTVVMAGNDTFSQNNITQNRKVFITQPKHIIFW